MRPRDVERGTLGGTSVPDLLKRLQEESLTGQLVLERDGVVRRIDFQDGRLVFARSTNPDDRLGEFLLRRGVVTLAQYQESAGRILPGKRQGAVLCEMGAISADELVKYVTEQVTEILLSLFHWTTGRFEVLPGDDDAPERIMLSIQIDDVILRGVRRITEWHRIWNGVGASVHTVLAPTAGASSLGYRAELTGDEQHVLSLVNGKLELGRIVELSYASSFETCRCLWALKLVRAVEPITLRDQGDSSPGEDYVLSELVESYDRAFAVVHGFVVERIGDLVDHFMDRALDLATGRHPAALGGVSLRNQARVEYEQVFANLAGRRSAARRAEAAGALADLLGTMLGLAAKELGLEEEAQLREQLDRLVDRLPEVPLRRILAQPTEATLALATPPS